MRPRRPAILPRAFYDRPALDVARDLLGKVLVHDSRLCPGPYDSLAPGVTSGKIVEVEAYIGEDDPACHAAPGPTPRNQPLYGDPGYAYVYFNYGVHDMFNVVVQRRGDPAAILVRALEPIDGIEMMRKRRSVKAYRVRHATARARREIAIEDLCRGPGNLARAMDVTLRDNRSDLCDGHLFIENRCLDVGEIAWSPRIGINVGTDRPWRCYVVGSRAVSGRKSARSDRASE